MQIAHHIFARKRVAGGGGGGGVLCFTYQAEKREKRAQTQIQDKMLAKTAPAPPVCLTGHGFVEV